MKTEKGRRRVNLLILLAVLVLITVVRLSNQPEQVSFLIQDGVMELSGPDASWQIPIRSIRQAVLEEDAVYPQPEDASGEVICGSFVNARWGEYVLCVNADIPVCIVLTGESGTYVFNYEDEQMTRSVCEAFQDLL